MKVNEALEIRTALLTLSDSLNIDAKELSSLILLFGEDTHKILLEAQKLWIEFYDSDIVERGKMMGIEVTLNDS